MQNQTADEIKLKYGETVELYGDVTLDADIPQKVTIKHTGGRLTLRGKLGAWSKITSNGDVVLEKEADAGTNITAARITADTMGSYAELTSTQGDITAKKIGDKGKLNSVGNITLDETGSHGSLKSAGSIDLQRGGYISEVTAAGAVNFGEVSYIHALKAASVKGKKIGDKSNITTTDGDIVLGEMGSHGSLKSAGDITLQQGGYISEMTAVGAVKFGEVSYIHALKAASVEGKKIGDKSNITTTSGDIVLGEMGSHGSLKSAKDIILQRGGYLGSINTAGAVNFGEIAHIHNLTAASVKGKKIGDKSNITTTSGNIELEEMGSHGSLTSAAGIQLGKAGRPHAVTAKGAVNFDAIEYAYKLEAASVKGGRLGKGSSVISTEGDVSLTHAGERVQIASAKDAYISETVGDYVGVTCPNGTDHSRQLRRARAEETHKRWQHLGNGIFRDAEKHLYVVPTWLVKLKPELGRLAKTLEKDGAYIHQATTFLDDKASKEDKLREAPVMLIEVPNYDKELSNKAKTEFGAFVEFSNNRQFAL